MKRRTDVGSEAGKGAAKNLRGFLAALLLLAGGVGFLQTGLSADQDKAKRFKDAGDIVPLESVVKHAKAKHPGTVLEVEFKARGGRYVYEIEILDEGGVVRELHYDAKSGELLKSERER